jgi:aryl-alcohol dehydrogenase-like predicted oxidoreductase
VIGGSTDVGPSHDPAADSGPDSGPARVAVRTVAGFTQSELLLGGAQLGGRYGIANTTGALGRGAVADLLREALDAGITHVDTARAYGDSERHIGAAGVDGLGIVTKIAPLRADATEPHATEPHATEPNPTEPDPATSAVDASVSRSLGELRRDSATFLLHRAADARAAGGAAWERLREYAGRGVARRIGVSVQSPAELRAVLELPDLGYVQLPVNVLDARWHGSGAPALLAGRPDVIVVARSVYLQGLLAAGTDVGWPIVSQGRRNHIVAALDRIARDLGYANRAALCMAYALSLPWITSVVVGAETPAQLRENVRLACLPRLAPAELEEVRTAIPEVPPALLDPSRWGS